VTEIVVTKIVELAKAGERDPEIPCIDVLGPIWAPARDVTSRTLPEPRKSVGSANEAD
jgi:hypothetical protein